MSELRVLIVEDTETDAELAVRELRKAGFVVTWERAESQAGLAALLARSEWDLVLSDYNIPGFGALQALQQVRDSNADLPFILVSGAIGEESAVDLIKLGAADFVMKSKLWRLPHAVERARRENLARKKERESAERAAAATTAREQVVSVVSHDLKNPLSAIDLNLQLIERILDTSCDPAQIRLQVNRARRSAERMRNLIRDILDQARIEAGRVHVELQHERLEGPVAEIVEMFHPLVLQKSIRLETRFSSSGVWVDFDRERIFQVLTNLIGNALKFTPTGGKITIEVDQKDQQAICLVRDTGPGIALEDQERIFERFWQTQGAERQGVGLGLSIAKGIIEAHHGRIWVTSVPGQGSCFGFSIPQASGTDTAVNPDMSLARPKGHTSVLLIDDDEDLREAIEMALVSQGYDVQAVHDAESGLELLEKNNKAPDVVLLDYSLPGINGAQFVERLRGLPGEMQRIPVILSSADRDLETKASQLPIQAVLKKPLSLDELLKVVGQVKNSAGYA